MAYIQVRDNESFEKTLKRFQKQVKKEGITTDLKRKRYHLKPSERKLLSSPGGRPGGVSPLSPRSSEPEGMRPEMRRLLDVLDADREEDDQCRENVLSCPFHVLLPANGARISGYSPAACAG